jgi:molybdopterin-guanine dinucleotide biosynthesis protein B
LLGNERWALMHELRGEPEPSLDYLIGRLQPCDLVLVEGFKEGHFPKIEVWRAELGRETLWPQWPGILGIASDTAGNPANPQRGQPLPLWFELSDTRAIADCVVEHALVF